MQKTRTPGAVEMVLTEKELQMLRTWGESYRSFIADYFRELPGPEFRDLLKRILDELHKMEGE